MARDPAGALAAIGLDLDTLPGTVAVCIPDLTRPLDPRPALQALECFLGPTMRVVVGLGLHRPMSLDELDRLARWSPRQSDADRADHYATVTVETSHGPRRIPGLVDRAVADATGIITVGLCELHQYAGFSGGHKGVVVGCGGRATIAALHHRDMVTDPRVLLGKLDDNPFRQAVDQLGDQLGVMLSLCFVPGPDRWLAGDPADVVRKAALLADPWQAIDAPLDQVMLRVPAAKAASFYQASRAATYLALSPRPPLVDGAELIVDAACTEGLGSESGFAAALASCPPPWSELLTGPPPSGPGAQRAIMLALLAQRYHLRVVNCQAVDQLRAVGIDATADPAPRGVPLIRRPFERLPQLKL